MRKSLVFGCAVSKGGRRTTRRVIRRSQRAIAWTMTCTHWPAFALDLEWAACLEEPVFLVLRPRAGSNDSYNDRGHAEGIV